MKTYKDIEGDGGSNIVEQVVEQLDKLKNRVSRIKNIVAVMSGKGGVGKSSVTVNLASSLKLQGYSVGILDADVNGPSIAKMTGSHNQKLEKGESGLLPATGFLDIKIMSMDLFLADDVTPVIWDAQSQKDSHAWRGMMEATAVREFISDTEWGVLDYLLIDLPPGTDKLSNIVDLIPQISGTIIVTIPTGISQFVVGKSIEMATSFLNTPVIGLIENMAVQFCRYCGKKDEFFPEGKVEEQAKQHNVPYLGSIPFDSQIAFCADRGDSFLSSYPEAEASKTINMLAYKVVQYLV